MRRGEGWALLSRRADELEGGVGRSHPNVLHAEATAGLELVTVGLTLEHVERVAPVRAVRLVEVHPDRRGQLSPALLLCLHSDVLTQLDRDRGGREAVVVEREEDGRLVVHEDLDIDWRSVGLLEEDDLRRLVARRGRGVGLAASGEQAEQGGGDQDGERAHVSSSSSRVILSFLSCFFALVKIVAFLYIFR